MNKSLAVGSVMLLLVFAVSLLGPSFSPYDPGYSENFITLETEKGPELFVAPHPPSSRHWLGTDHWGYDLFSLLCAGARYTFSVCLLTALFRVLLGTGLGLLRGMSSHPGKPAALSSSLNGSLPVFIIIYFILFGIVFNPALSPAGMTLLQIFLMVLFGIGPVAAAIEEKCRLLRQEPFYESGISVGAGPFRLMRYYILPFLKEIILILFSQETVAVLTLIGQLGIFHVFIGGTRVYYSPVEYHSITHEWAGLVGLYRNKLQGDSWWIILFPLAGYLFLLFAFFLVSRGVEQRYSEK